MPQDAQVAADGLAAMRAALPAYTTAAAFYNGRQEEKFFSAKLRDLLRGSGEAHRVNLVKTCVDAVTERLEFAAITADTDEAKRAVDEVWADNGLGLGVKDVHSTAGVFGDAYIIAVADQDQASGVLVGIHDPTAVRVFYDPSRPTRKTHAIHWWVQRGGGTGDDGDGLDAAATYVRVNIYYPDRVALLVSDVALGVDGRVDWDNMTFRGYDDDLPIEGGVVPVFHFRAGSGQYGTPEHAEGYGAQRGLDKAITTLMASMDSAGFPQRYALQDENAQARFAQPPEGGGFGPGAPVGDTATERTLRQAGPAVTWLLEGVKQVGQFPAASLQQFLDVGARLVSWMASATDTPLHYFEAAAGFPSGASRREATAPLLKKAADRQARYGVEWRAFARYVLALKGVTGEVAFTWAPLTVEHGLEDWQVVAAKVAAGVPVDLALQEQGYLAAEIADWPVVVAARAERLPRPA